MGRSFFRLLLLVPLIVTVTVTGRNFVSHPGNVGASPEVIGR